MGRQLHRVPLDFDWPLGKVWKGYINPYADLMTDCPACVDPAHPYRVRGYSPDGLRYHNEWYGCVEFDPVAYGATPITIDNPRIREHAMRSVAYNPEYYGSGKAAVDREVRRLFEVCIKNHWCHHLNQADVDALAAEGRLKGPVTAEEVNDRMLFGMGHDSINAWVCMKTRAEREGVCLTWL